MISSNPMHVYIDTQYLHAYLFPTKSNKRSDVEYIAKTQVTEVLYNNNSLLFLKIPFIVVGEFINNIHKRSLSENDKADITRQFLNLMGEPKVDFVPPTMECFQLSKDLNDGDRNLQGTDTLIVAHALCDPLSSHLLTKDGPIITSTLIQDIIKKDIDDGIRKQHLKITPEFKKRI